MYTPIVQDHFENPRNVGVIDQADADALVSNPACGDTMHLYLRIADNRIVEAKFKNHGLPCSDCGQLYYNRNADRSDHCRSLTVDACRGQYSPGRIKPAKSPLLLSEDAVKAPLSNYQKS